MAVESAQAGKPVRLAGEFDVPGTIDNIRFFAAAARMLHGSAAAEWDGTHTSVIRREPIGVVGSIAPGTIRCRWRPGSCCRRSPRATRS